MRYHEVIETQEKLSVAIEATKSAEADAGNINSIVKLMALSSPALMPNLDKNNKELLSLDVVRSQMSDLRMMMEMMMCENRRPSGKSGSLIAIEYERISNKLDKLGSGKIPPSQADMEYSKLMQEVDVLMSNCMNESDHMMVKYLMDRVYRQRDEIFRNK